jgi:hypothetical protein
MISNFDVMLIPFLPNNIIHFLDPIVTSKQPERIIICSNGQRDLLSNENFQSYISNNNLNYVQVKRGWKIIPSPQCTCTIIENGQNREWYEPEKPAIIKFILGETTLIFNGEKTEESRRLNNSPYLRINNVTVHNQSKDLIDKITIYSEDPKLSYNFNTAIDGAVRIKTKLKPLK